MTKDYRRSLRAKGIKPLVGKLRTEKPAGSIEIVWDQRAGDYVKHVHEGETVRPKLRLVGEKRAAAV